jgi:capsular polysaccharide transport system permease protein
MLSPGTRTQAAPQSPTETGAIPVPASGRVPAPIAPLIFPSPARVQATQSRLRLLSSRIWSFLIIVVLPVAIGAIYYLAIAADQYVAEFRMTLRRVEAPQIAPLSLFGGDVVQSTAASESQIVAQYIASRAIVDELDPTIDLRKLFSSPSADWWARLHNPASIEELVRYWNGQVDPFYDTSTGTIVVRLRAFAPVDALRLAQAVVASSEKLVNDLSARARRDAVGHAETEVAAAEARLTAALDKIREFRDKAGLIDPNKTADATGQLATKLRDDLIKANSQLATLKTFMRDDAPPVRVMKARIHSLEIQQRGLAQEMTTTGQPTAPALSQTLGSYETLEAERKFAEAAYQHALEALDKARDTADRQQIYIASFVPPSLPEEALYPHRWRSLGVVALIAFAVWAIGALALQSVRDHL